MNDEENVTPKPANYSDDTPKAPSEDKSTQAVLHETYQVPAINHAPDYQGAPVTVIVGTPNTLRPPEGFPKMIYRDGNPSSEGMLCANQEIADDWAKRGFVPAGEASSAPLPVPNAPDPVPDPTLMPHQHALDAPAS